MLSLRSRRWLPVAAVIAIYVTLGVGRALTTEPWNDEAWYASPSWSLIHHGNTGTPLLETAGRFWKGINQRTYWVVPLQFFVQVPWFKLLGFNLLTARLYALTWGLGGLLAWALIVKRFASDSVMGFWTMLLLACDYQFVSQTALDRMDAMSLALAAFAILSYVELRERNMAGAILFSQLCVAACGLTHPTAGVPAFCAALFLILYYDRRRIRAKHLALAAVPYIVGAAGWAWYISLAPEWFKVQFFGNVTDIDRLGGFRHPLTAIVRELGRYAGMAGFAAGMTPFYKIKAAVLAVYAFSVVSLFATRQTRQDPGIRPMLGLWLVYVLAMTFYDNTKEVKYGVHLMPIYDALAAVWLVWLWRRGRASRWAAAAAGVVFVVVSVGGLLYTILVKDDYHRSYLPMANFLRQNAGTNDLILAGSELGFALGFDRRIVDDTEFTYYSHKTPDFIVIGDNYRPFIEYDRRVRPQIYLFLEDMLAHQYRLVYQHAGFEIFERRNHPNALPPVS